MSTILDALRRLEKDRRRRAATAPLEARVVEPERTGPRLPRHVLAMAAAVAVVALLIVTAGFLVLRPGQPAESTVDVAATSAGPITAPAPELAPPPAPRRAVATLPRVAAAGAPVPPAERAAAGSPRPGTESLAANPDVAVSATPAPQADPAEAVAVPNIRPISMLPLARSTPPAREAEPAVVPPARTAAKPASSPPPSRAAHTPPPTAPRSVARSADPAIQPQPGPGGASRSEPSPTARTETESVAVAPRPREVSVLKTVWHPNEARRVARVSIAGESGDRQVRVGDVVEGLEVREIKLSGVVFGRAGVTIERRVGRR